MLLQEKSFEIFGKVRTLETDVRVPFNEHIPAKGVGSSLSWGRWTSWLVKVAIDQEFLEVIAHFEGKVARDLVLVSEIEETYWPFRSAIELAEQVMLYLLHALWVAQVVPARV